MAVGKEIPILPRHAVLAAEVCYRIALNINEKLRELLGTEGLVYMAAYHALLSEDRIPTHGRKFPESFINYVLTGRYRVDVGKREVIGVLKSIGKWNEYRRTFDRSSQTGSREEGAQAEVNLRGQRDNFRARASPKASPPSHSTPGTELPISFNRRYLNQPGGRIRDTNHPAKCWT